MAKYRTIVADPPWPIKDSGERTASYSGQWKGRLDGAMRVPYKTMTIKEIGELPVGALAAADAHLYLWTINAYLREAYYVAQTWGFRPSQLLTWCKAPRGLGFGGAFTNSTEFILFARRGSLAPLRRWDRTHFNWKRPYENGRPAHSKKPEGLMDVAEVTSPPPRVELFARAQRLGWDSWGYEALNHVTLTPPWREALNSTARRALSAPPEVC